MARTNAKIVPSRPQCRLKIDAIFSSTHGSKTQKKAQTSIILGYHFKNLNPQHIPSQYFMKISPQLF